MINITNMFMKKIYQFLQSKIGLILVIALYFILAIPLTTSADAIQEALGKQIGMLLSPLVIVLVLSRFFKWNRNQKILHAFLIAFLFEVLLSQKSLVPIVNFISLIALPTLIIQFIFEAFRRKK